jgi:hypothetical protein
MPNRSNVPLPDLLIPNGAAVSNILRGNEVYEDADAIMLIAPAVIGGALTYLVEVSDDPKATAASTFRTLQVGDDTFADLVPPPQAKAKVVYELAAAPAFRIKASGNVAADLTFKATKSVMA